MHGHTHFKGINFIFRAGGTYQVKSLVCEGCLQCHVLFSVTDFIEHVTELEAHMAAVAV